MSFNDLLNINKHSHFGNIQNKLLFFYLLINESKSL